MSSPISNPSGHSQYADPTEEKAGVKIHSTPPASKSPAPNMDLEAQDQRKNPKSEGLQWDLRFRGGLGPSPIGLENFRVGLEI